MTDLIGLIMLIPVWLFVAFCVTRTTTPQSKKVGTFLLAWTTVAMLLVAAP